MRIKNAEPRLARATRPFNAACRSVHSLVRARGNERVRRYVHAKFSCLRLLRTRPPRAGPLPFEQLGGNVLMAYRLGSGKGKRGAHRGWRFNGAFRLFAAFALFLSAISPLRQAAARQADPADTGGLQQLLAFGGGAPAGIICHYEENGPQTPPDGDTRSRLCKDHCLLCFAHQLQSPAVVPSGIAWPLPAGIAVAPAPLAAARTPERPAPPAARPRAPPLA